MCVCLSRSSVCLESAAYPRLRPIVHLTLTRIVFILYHTVRSHCKRERPDVPSRTKRGGEGMHAMSTWSQNWMDRPRMIHYAG